MSDTKHTPGPWRVQNGSVYALAPDGSFGSLPVAHMDRDPGNGTRPVERDANARLIAAAPEMVEALRGALEVLDGRANDFSSKSEACKACRAAIRKAEGRGA